MFENIFCSGLCWSMKKICRFKCGNNNKTENLFKNNSRIGLGSYQDRSKRGVYGLSSYYNQGQRLCEIFN